MNAASDVPPGAVDAALDPAAASTATAVETATDTLAADPFGTAGGGMPELDQAAIEEQGVQTDRPTADWVLLRGWEIGPVDAEARVRTDDRSQRVLDDRAL